MTLENVQNINIGVAYIVEAFISSQTHFHLVMETENWEPALPDDIRKNNKALFSFVNDTLKECISTDAGIYLFVNINNNNYTYEITEDSLIFIMFGDHKQKPTKPGQIIFNRPEMIDEDVYIDEEKAREHSMSMFLNNPDNEKFFK